MNKDDNALIKAALTAREAAYCRYSGYAVGAAVLDEQGRTHIGCNVENVSYPLGNCAETSAIAAMIAAGGKRIVCIAIAGGSDELGNCTPCGGCRQRIDEFADEATRIIVHEDNRWIQYTMAELLPASFRLP